jgi:hypothetical protein
MSAVEVGQTAPDPVVFSWDGARTTLSSAWRDRPAVVAFLRHFG